MITPLPELSVISLNGVPMPMRMKNPSCLKYFVVFADPQVIQDVVSLCLTVLQDKRTLVASFTEL